MRSILILLVVRSCVVRGELVHSASDYAASEDDGDDYYQRLDDVNGAFLKANISSNCRKPADIQKLLETESPNLASLVKMLQKKQTTGKHKSAFANCSRNDKSAVHLDDKTKRYGKRSCSTEKGMWGLDRTAAAKCKYDRVNSLFGLKAGFKLLDWGAGCGETANYLGLKSNADVFAVDLVPGCVEYGKKLPHVTDYFLTPEISSLACFPDNSFDVITSNAATCHLSPDLQCKLWKEHFVRILRPGGCAWDAWYNSGVCGHRESPLNLTAHMEKCLGADDKIVFLVLNEIKLFNVSEYDNNRSQSLIVCKE